MSFIPIHETFHTSDPFGGYTEIWMCEFPGYEFWYKVLREEWNEDYSVRKIYEVEVCPN